MITFLDASAVVAMIAEESDALQLADRLDEASELIWSPITVWESTLALARIRKQDHATARGDIYAFGREWRVRLVSIGADEGEIAIEAHQLYGKASGSPAKLNLGDCFAYASTKTHQAKLLYKGDDFTHTDLR